MLMVCTNCKSKDIISIQDQFFCINCGQMVSPGGTSKSKSKSTKTFKTVHSNLPSGIKITEPNDNTGETTPAVTPPETAAKSTSSPTGASSKPHVIDLSQAVITNHRTSRILADLDTNSATESAAMEPPAAETPTPTKARKRKPGRPKAGRLDVPQITLVPGPKSEPDPEPESKPDTKPTAHHRRQVSDILKPPKLEPAKEPAPAHHVHKVGVAPLHFGSVVAFSLKAQAKKHHLVLAMGSAVIAGVMAAVGAWFLLTTSPEFILTTITNHWLVATVEAVALIKLYYIGRTIGHAAITYGVAREADHRPISLGLQISAAVNSFTRRLRIDVLYALTQIALICAIISLVIAGGASWPVPPAFQVLVLYGSFLVLLYLMSAAAITRGLAAVAVVLTNLSPTEAYKLGWHLYRHRLELVGIRMLSCLVEILVVLPLLGAAISLYLFLPPFMTAGAAIGIGLVTWLAGSLMGAGSAAWWAGVYRKIVILDLPARQFELLASRVPGSARGRYLAILAAVTGFLLASVLIIPLLMG